MWLINLTQEQEFLICTLIGWVIIYGLSKLTNLKRFGLEVKPLILIYESSRFKEFIQKFQEKEDKYTRIFLNISILISIGLMAYAFYFLSNNIMRLIQVKPTASPVVLVLPGITIRLYWIPYLIAAAAITVFSHEFSHGLAARIHGINIKSAGAFIAFLLPGGFVEPIEEEFKKTKLIHKLRVLSAGPSINLVMGLIAMLMLFQCFAPPTGLVILDTVRESPLNDVGLKRWDVIYAINGTPVRDSYELYIFMRDVKPGETLVLKTSRGAVVIEAMNYSGRAVLGLTAVMSYYPLKLNAPPQFSIHFYVLTLWCFMLFMGAAIFSMLPIYPFDGERFISYVLEAYLKKGVKPARIAINVVSLGLLGLNVAFTFIRFGIFSF